MQYRHFVLINIKHLLRDIIKSINKTSYPIIHIYINPSCFKNIF